MVSVFFSSSVLRIVSKGSGRASEDVNPSLLRISTASKIFQVLQHLTSPSRIEHIRVTKDMFSQVHVLQLCRTRRRVLCVVTRCYSWLAIFTFHG